jgi:hypothetical protein
MTPYHQMAFFIEYGKWSVYRIVQKWKRKIAENTILQNLLCRSRIDTVQVI